ncbi:MAG: hypothetical protein ACR2M7_04895 [Bdellovibrionales bacterium]
MPKNQTHLSSWFSKSRLRYTYVFLKEKYLKTKYQLKKLNNKGQGLIEYLILIALMGIATIGIIRTLNQTIKSRFANAVYALQGRPQKAKTDNVRKKDFQRSDLSNFMNGAASSDEKQKRSKPY